MCVHVHLPLLGFHLGEDPSYPPAVASSQVISDAFLLVKMGSRDWFKTIISRKKTKQDKSRRTKGPTTEQSLESKSNKHNNGVSNVLTEDVAATRIQTVFRVHKARKTLHSLKGAERLRTLAQNLSVRNQASTTLGHIQMWSRIQSQISARRLCMVTEGRIKQKKLDSQLKVEAKLHDLEVEWCGGSETMEEIIARIQQRAEAAVKRERAMAYAFSHQWRANSGQNQGPFAYEFGDGNWGWSWMERWIAARPWESRTPTHSTKTISPTKSLTKTATKVDKKSPKIFASVKPAVSNGKRLVRRLSYPTKVERTINMETDPGVLASSPIDNNGSNINGDPQTS